MFNARSGKDCQKSEYYRLAESNDEIDEQGSEALIPKQRSKFYERTIFLVLIFVISNIATAILSVSTLQLRPKATSAAVANLSLLDNTEASQSYPILDQLPTVYTKFEWRTRWGTASEAANATDSQGMDGTTADELWAGVIPAHGIIAVDRQWAKERHWPDSMYNLKDPLGKQKGVYILEAYHMLHCLTILRTSLVEANRSAANTWPSGHIMHCFDVLRQSIQCHADNTPLYTFGDSTAGDGQIRECKSWDALRDFATEHSACYADLNDTIPLKDHYGHCEAGKPFHDGKDGLP